MIFTRSTQYAIQILVLIATRPAGTVVMVRDLAAHLRLPAAYLSKLLPQLTRAGMLKSTRGRRGGYCLQGNADALSLKDVVQVVCGEQALGECLLGLQECVDENACPMHGRWRPVKEELFALLARQSVGKLAKAVNEGRCRLEDLNLARMPPSAPITTRRGPKADGGKARRPASVARSVRSRSKCL